MNKEREVVSRQVLHVLSGRLHHYTDLDVWLSHNYDSARWEPIFAKEEATIKEIRAWAKATLPLLSLVRSEYLRWLTYYYEWGLNEARRELRDQKIRKDQERYNAESRDLSAALSNTLSIPTPSK